jgi:hypothetical protein
LTRRGKGLTAAAAVLLAVGAGAAYWRWSASALPPAPTAAELEALTKKRDELQARVRELVREKGEANLAAAPPGGVMIGIPVSLTEDIAGQIVSGVFRETTLVLRNLKVHKEGEVRAKLLFRKKTLGNFVLDVDIQEAIGQLRPAPPRISIDRGRFTVALGVELAEGHGKVSLGFKWDSHGLAANAVCGDLDVTREVTGRVVPARYELAGAFDVKTDGGSIVLDPHFGDLAVRLQVEPTEEAWGVVDAVLAEQRSGCRMALEKLDIKKVLGRILEKGFNIKVPKKFQRPIALPAGLRQSLELQGVKLALRLTPTKLVVTPERLWYAADVFTTAETGGPSGGPGVKSTGQGKEPN